MVKGTGLVATNRPTLVFLHGFPLGPEMWKAQKEAFEAAGYRVVAPDLRIESTIAENGLPEPVTMEQMADAAAAAVEQAGGGSFIPIGFSMGGYVTFALAEKYPDRLAGIVLVDTRAEADSEEGRAGRRDMAVKVMEHGAKAAAEAMVGKLLSPGTLQNRPDIAAEVGRIILSASPAAIAASSLGMALRPDRTGMLRSIRVPALVIVGAEDAITPPDVAQNIAAAIPDAELEVIPGAGHLANMEQPEAFQAALSTWLSRF